MKNKTGAIRHPDKDTEGWVSPDDLTRLDQVEWQKVTGAVSC